MTSKHIFPVLEEPSLQTPTTVLFPAFLGKPKDASKKGDQLDWLSNSSFKVEEAVIIHHNQARQTFHEAEVVSIDSGSYSDETGKHAATSKAIPQKSSYCIISDDEFSDEPPSKKHKKKKKKDKKEKHKHKRKRDGCDNKHANKEDKSRKEEPIPIGTHGGKIFIEDMPSNTLGILYRIDCKPDLDNLRYLELYKRHVAQYRRFGRGCLGLPANEILLLQGVKRNDRKAQVPEDTRYYRKIGNMKTLKSHENMGLSRSSVNETRKSRFDQSSNVMPQFIPIEKAQVETKNVGTNPLGIYDAQTICYLEGKPSEKQKKLQEFSEEDRNLTDVFHGNYILSRTAEFNKHLKTHPDDISKWLEFVEFQEEALSSDMSEQFIEESNIISDKSKKKPNRLLLLEIKISIIEEALKKNPASIKLKMAQLELCADQWELTKLDHEWEQLVFKHPNKPQVWLQRLLFLQSSVSLFSISKLIKAYAKCLKMLTSIRVGTFLSHTAEPHLEEYILVIFRQLLNVLLQAGHTEKATALIQATIEVNLFCPHVLHNASRSDKLQFLDNFWESCVPRSGETGALGFASWIDRKGAVPFCSMYSQNAEGIAEDEAIADVASRCEGWLALEKSRASRHLFPWRPNISKGESEEDCEDLERIVMLDDISSCVILFESELCRLGLLTTYLQLLGIKKITSGISVDKVMQKSLQSGLDNLTQLSPCPILEKSVLFSDTPLLMYQAAIDVLVQVQTANIFKGYHATFINLTLMDVREQHLGIKQTSGSLSGKDWKSSCKQLRKNAKNLLKEAENRNNLLMWQQYVDLEWVFGSIEDSRKVLHTALSMTPALSIDSIADTYQNCATCKLYRHYAEVELGLYIPSLCSSEKTTLGDFKPGSEKTALYVLASLAAIDQFKPPDESRHIPATLILRARNAFQACLEELLLQQGDISTQSQGATLRVLPQAGTILAHWSVSFALFQYLTIGIGAAVSIFEQVLLKMQTFISLARAKSSTSDDISLDMYLEDNLLYYETVCEDLILAQLKLYQRHMSAKVAPKSLLRIPLQHYLQVRPDSSLLLNMYTEFEAMTTIVGRMRRFLLGLTTSCNSPLVWIYGTLGSLMRHQKLITAQHDLIENHNDLPEWMLPSTSCGVGSQHQLRAWLGRAVIHPTTKSCILLWRLYFKFEITEGESLKAKSVYYRGIAQCPMAKALCMDFMQAFPEHLEEVMDFMLEKELRLRVPIEEVDVLLPAFVVRKAALSVAEQLIPVEAPRSPDASALVDNHHLGAHTSDNTLPANDSPSIQMASPDGDVGLSGLCGIQDISNDAGHGENQNICASNANVITDKNDVNTL